MALTTPILHTTAAFDATEPHTFTFYVRGGDTVTANQLTIKNNVSLAQIYSVKQTTFASEHVLPANTLQNGTYYQAYINTFNSSDAKSSDSNIIQFHCHTKPVVSFTNIPSNNIISSNSFNFQVTYNQKESVGLQSYTFNLYSSSGSLTSTSGVLYNTSSEVPITVDYLFAGFDDGQTYQIEFVGMTNENTEFSTDRINLLVQYRAPTVYSTLYADNNCEGGYVTIRSNVLNIEGTTVPASPKYIGGEEIDLRNKNSYVEWKEGYELPLNWTSRIWARDITDNTEIIRFSNTYGDKVTVTYLKDGDKVLARLDASPPSWDRGYTIFSNEIATPSSTETIFFWIRKINGLFDLEIENRGVLT